MKREENQTVEYKQSWHDKYLEWICGYANAKGGTLYIGIDNATKEPVGLRDPDKLMEDIPNSIRNTMGLVPDVALVKTKGKPVVRIRVKPSGFPVSFRGAYFYRTGAVKMQLVGNALTEFLLSKSGMSWDAAPSSGGFARSEHAFTALAALYRKTRKAPLAESDFESFGLSLPDGRLTNAGALFADDCPLRHSRVFCTRWNGLDMAAGVMDARDDQEYSGGILSILRYAEEFVRLNSRRSWHKTRRSRAEFVEYPERAVHEALVNAFIHRDYLVTGSEVHVDLFDDRLEITSPGGMPGERRIEEFDVRKIPSIRRNGLLADMCERLRIMERRGSGFKKIFEDYGSRSFNPARRTPGLESTPIYFRVTLPNLLFGLSDEQLAALAEGVPLPVVPPVVPPVAPPVPPPVRKPSEALLDSIQRRVIARLAEEVLSTSELALKVGISQPKDMRRRYLRLLLDMGLIEYTIPGKPNSRLQKYRLTAKGRAALA